MKLFKFIVPVALMSSVVLANPASKEHTKNSMDLSKTLQANTKKILSKYQAKLPASMLSAIVMDSKTGQVVAFGAQERNSDSNTSNILVTHQFEPGGIMKPITISLALDLGKTTLDERFKTYNVLNHDEPAKYGEYKIGKYSIKDFSKNHTSDLSVKEIIKNSSNIGTLQIANKIDTDEFIDGLHRFGINKKTSIDFADEKIGYLPTLETMTKDASEKQPNMYKAAVSYGQAMTATLPQLVKAYGVFNNDGAISSPRIKNIEIDTNKPQVISKNTANTMKSFLIESFSSNLKNNANTKNIEIGGKITTGFIPKKNGDGYSYSDDVYKLFVGFANDHHGHNYTIGIMVFDPKTTKAEALDFKPQVQVLEEIVQNLIDTGFLSNK